MTAQRVAGTLAGVQAQVAKEAVVWRSGPLVMAPLVNSTLGAAQVALHCCCLQPCCCSCCCCYCFCCCCSCCCCSCCCYCFCCYCFCCCCFCCCCFCCCLMLLPFLSLLHPAGLCAWFSCDMMCHMPKRGVAPLARKGVSQWHGLASVSQSMHVVIICR